MFLVQRIKTQFRKQLDARTGVDRHFSMDYMGSAEFEFGALPKSLREMREKIKSYEIVPLKHEGHKAWLVSVPKSKQQAQDFFADQLGERNTELKERTAIHNAYNDEQYYEDLIGWWALDGSPHPWAFFRKKEHAKQWLADLKDGGKE